MERETASGSRTAYFRAIMAAICSAFVFVDTLYCVCMQLTWIANAVGTTVNLKLCEEQIVSYLPLSHVAAQVNDLWISIRFAATTSFAQPDALKVMGLVISVIPIAYSTSTFL